MSEVDHVLEARARIEALANELNKIKETAELFDGAQSKQEAVIKAADAVVEHAGDFVNDATEIIANLKQINLPQRLGDIERDLQETNEFLGRQFEKLGEHLGEIRRSTDQLREAANGIVSSVSEEHERTRTAVTEKIESVRREGGEQLASFRTQSLIATGIVGILVAFLVALHFV